MKGISALILICVCVLGVCQNSVAAQNPTGCGRPKPDECSPDINTCPNGTACLSKEGDTTTRCWPCPCRKPEQCYMEGKIVKCSCGDEIFGDNCECRKAKACPPSWILHGRSCYHFDLYGATTLTWEAAKQYCENNDPMRQSGLVKVDNEDEHDFIKNQLSEPGVSGYFWIGGSYDTTASEYRWRDGSTVPATDTFWAPGSPGSEQGCMFYVKNMITSVWEWGTSDTGACTGWSTHFICETNIQ